MIKYPVKTEKNEVKTAGIGLPISTKNSVIICKRINKMELAKSKIFLERLIEKKDKINGKHYTKTCRGILGILESAEKNAEFRGLNNPVIKTICAEKGAKRLRMKRRRSFGSSLKNTNIKIVLKEGVKRPGKENKGEKNEHKK